MGQNVFCVFGVCVCVCLVCVCACVCVCVCVWSCSRPEPIRSGMSDTQPTMALTHQARLIIICVYYERD